MKKTASPPTERPPIVVVMGHVDHGKSTLLDTIRKTNTVEHEAGGITQHVAAYEVEHEHEGSKKRITFIDTPGHAAFQAIRARGANVADIAILVVAADDGVKAQTLEALSSIKESGIPFVVAINKIDKPNADMNRTQASLLEHGVYLEKLGGDVPWAQISAKAGTGVSELLDLVLIVAELQNLTGSLSEPAEGYVIEAHRDQKRGIAATLIIRNGTLQSGNAVIAGRSLAPVRIMENHLGKPLKTASFSSPITLIGFDELPEVGAKFVSYKNKKDAEKARPTQSKKQEEATTLVGDQFSIPLVIKADTSGSIEAITHEIAKLGSDRARLTIIQSGIGSISENDIKQAAATATNHALVIGFHVTGDANALERARQNGVEIETFDIIYKLTERLEQVLLERTPKREVEEIVGKAKVLKLFSSRKGAAVLGGSVAEGSIRRGMQLHVLRRKIPVGDAKVSNLQLFKQKVDSVEAPNEFGAEIETDFEIAPGDMLECFHVVVK